MNIPHALKNAAFMYCGAVVGAYFGELEIHRVGIWADLRAINALEFMVYPLWVVYVAATPAVVVLAFAPMGKWTRIVSSVLVGAAVFSAFALYAREEGSLAALAFGYLWFLGVPFAGMATAGLWIRKRHVEQKLVGAAATNAERQVPPVAQYDIASTNTQYLLRNAAYIYGGAVVGAYLGELEIHRVLIWGGAGEMNLLQLIFFPLALVLIAWTPTVAVLATAPLDQRSRFVSCVAAGVVTFSLSAYYAHIKGEEVSGAIPYSGPYSAFLAFSLPIAFAVSIALWFRTKTWPKSKTAFEVDVQPFR